MNPEQKLSLFPHGKRRAIATHIAAILVLSASELPSKAEVIVGYSAQTDSFSATNKNKIAVSGGRLHLVYTKGAIYYSPSPNPNLECSGGDASKSTAEACGPQLQPPMALSA